LKCLKQEIYSCYIHLSVVLVPTVVHY
jgi:hypothetical protein